MNVEVVAGDPVRPAAAEQVASKAQETERLHRGLALAADALRILLPRGPRRRLFVPLKVASRYATPRSRATKTANAAARAIKR